MSTMGILLAALAPTSAIVTTHDAPPAGDLRVLDRPNGAQIGGAEKNGTVSILSWDADGTGAWARVSWGGGARWPAVTGYVRRAYLTPVASSAPSSGGAAGGGATPVLNAIASTPKKAVVLVAGVVAAAAVAALFLNKKKRKRR